MCQSGHLQIVNVAIMDEAGEGFWQKYLYQEILYQPLNQQLYLGPAKSPQEKITSQNSAYLRATLKHVFKTKLD